MTSNMPPNYSTKRSLETQMEVASREGACPAWELAQLYLRRWSVELFFRHIKTTMQMDMLRCLSPALLHREVLLHLIAYNLIRGMMAEAAGIYDQDVARLSFKGSVQTVRHFSQVIAQASSRRKAVQL